MAKQRTPEAVLAAAKRAEELHKSLYGAPDPDAQQESEAPEAQTQANAPEGGTIQPVEPTGTPPGPDTSAPPPTAAPDGGAAAQPVQPPQAEPPKEDWEAKYRVLQGKYNSEVPRLAADLRAMRQQLDELQQARTAAPQTPPAASPDNQKKEVVTNEEVEEYGEDLINLIRRVARAEAAQIETMLKPKIEQVEGRVVETVQRQASQNVFSVLDRDVQDWREINKSPDFVEWLSQSDPYVGDTRKNLLMSAFQEGDADRVAAFFKGYLAHRQLVSPPPPAPAATPAPAPAVTLEQLAGPASGPTGAPTPPPPRGAQIVTRAEVQKFYNDVAAGVYRKDPERKAQIEAQIAAALREGRIQ
jgi:hypothetical protein